MINTDLSEHIHESNLIEGFDSQEADEQSIAAWQWLLEQDEITDAVIKHLQARITKHQGDLKTEWRGLYRKIPVYIGGHEAMDALRIEPAMHNWIAHLHDTKPHQHHVTFEKIHPFVDGNGRTGRMLMWWQQVKIFKMHPTLITYNNRAEYYRWFS